eukprot:COSAG02_NODE_6560_length_3494_cov_53.005302_4_plen_58_part_00
MMQSSDVNVNGNLSAYRMLSNGRMRKPRMRTSVKPLQTLLRLLLVLPLCQRLASLGR